MSRRPEGEPEGQNLSDEEKKASLRGALGEKTDEVAELFNKFRFPEETKDVWVDDIYDKIAEIKPNEISTSKAKILAFLYAENQYNCALFSSGSGYIGHREVFPRMDAVYEIGRWHKALEDATQNHWETLSRELNQDSKDLKEGKDPVTKETSFKLRLIGAKLHSLSLA